MLKKYVFSLTTTIELDIWDSKRGFHGTGAVPRNWFVKYRFDESGNNNNAGGSLKAALLRVKGWSQKHPDHPGLFFWI